MDRILSMILRMVMRKVARKGVGMTLDAGGKAWNARKMRKAGAQSADIEQDPAVTARRKLHDDERRGDDILYPTDEFTEDLQPRR